MARNGTSSRNSAPRTASVAGAGNGARRRPVSRETRGLREAVTVSEPAGSIRAPDAALVTPREVSRYGGLVQELRARYKISIRKWRTDMAGVAYELRYRDGRIKRLIAAPRPRSPVSAAIFLHEVGHHAIGFQRYPQRCLEEHYVWQWTFREMHARGIPVTGRVQRHYQRSMHHYVRRAQMREEHVPGELMHFGQWPG